jgi:hypothetical protein
MFEIESGYPPPARGKPRVVLPLDKMKIGDSIFIPAAAGFSKDRVRRQAKAMGVSVQVAPATKGDQTGMRVWRAR